MTTYYFTSNEIPTKQKPRAITTSFSPEGWKPVSPPLTNLDYFTPTTPTPSRRASNTPWLSLFSTATWQPEQNSLDQESSPVNLEFLDSFSTADDYFQMNKSGLGNNNQSSQAAAISSPISFSKNESSIWAFSKENFTRPLTPPPQSPTKQIQQLIQQVQQQQKIDEYFSPTLTMIDVQSLGKGVYANQLKDNQPIYQVQFKVKHKIDYFYILDDKERFSIGDMVVVEADRGYDIGKIITIIEKDARKKKKVVSNDTVLKRIFRLASQTELLTLELGKQDEKKALVICQAKIKQKNLNMQVVEAEYQWDRRKLTFYFKANERIDFRELVRELFKVYKTRIWMCASTAIEN